MQCFTCLKFDMRGQPKGKGMCDGELKDALKDGCKDHKLASMEIVRSRSKRRVTFDASGKVVLT